MSAFHLLNAATCTLFLLVAVQALRPSSRGSESKLLAFWALTLAALVTAPYYNLTGFGPAERGAQTLLYTGANLAPVSSALLAFWIFEERRISSWMFWVPACAGLVLDGYDFYVSGFGNWPNSMAMNLVFEYLPQVIKLGYLGLAIYAAVRSWKDDLITGRFRLRYLVVALGLAVGLEMLFVENLWAVTHDLPYDPEHFHSLWQAGLAIWLSTQGLSIQRIQWANFRGETGSVAKPATDWSAPLRRLNCIMRDQERFRDPALTLQTLAREVGLPEYRMRQLINRELGHRNFNAFLNDYRIDAASRDLQDPEKNNLPVLTIAMDAGYGSLAPFNKAFKERLHITPTQYRKRQPGA